MRCLRTGTRISSFKAVSEGTLRISRIGCTTVPWDSGVWRMPRTTPASGAIIPVNSITLNWSASDTGTGLDHFELSLDGGTPIRLDANVSGYTVSAPSDGNHTVQVTAFDGANNSAAASVTVTVDTTPP